MIISRYLTKEIFTTLFAGSFVLLLIFLSNKLVRYLGYAAAGKVAPNILLQLMGFEIPYLLSLLLPLGLYLAIIIAYGRLYADSELRVMHACGLSVARLIAITSFFVLFITSVVLALTLWVNPWIVSHKQKLIANSISTDNILNTLMPGRFQVSPDGHRVLYVEQINRNRRRADNLFLADLGQKNSENNENAWTVVSASNGSQVMQQQDRFIVANEGFRYEGIPGVNDFQIVHFKKYAVRLPQTTDISEHHEIEAIPTKQLFQKYQKTENASELQWRISIPLSCLFLSLLAIPLSRVHPRGGRYTQLVPAVLIYVVYMNLLFVARSWVEQKFLPVSVGLWWVHGVVLLLGVIFLMVQTGWFVKPHARAA